MTELLPAPRYCVSFVCPPILLCDATKQTYSAKAQIGESEHDTGLPWRTLTKSSETSAS